MQLGQLAKKLARAKSAISVQDAYYVLSASSLLTTSGKLPKPVTISLQSASVPLSSVSPKPKKMWTWCTSAENLDCDAD